MEIDTDLLPLCLAAKRGHPGLEARYLRLLVVELRQLFIHFALQSHLLQLLRQDRSLRSQERADLQDRDIFCEW